MGIKLSPRLLVAFSLVELLIVIAIIGLLSAIAIPSYNQYIIKAKMVEFFILADSYKLKLVEKIINAEQQPEANYVINNPSHLVEKLEYIHIENKKYLLKLTANMQNLGIQTINHTPLTVQFIAEENQSSNLIIWSCNYNAGYSAFMSKHCQEIL